MNSMSFHVLKIFIFFMFKFILYSCCFFGFTVLWNCYTNIYKYFIDYNYLYYYNNEGQMTKKVVPCFVFGMLNPIMTIIIRVMWRFAGAVAIAASNYITDKILSYVNNFLTLLTQHFISIVSRILTWGGIIALFLDAADGSFDSYVTIRI